MPHALTSSIAGVVAFVTLAAFGAPEKQGQQPRTVYVSVTDKNGMAITDMQAAEFEVKEGGKTREIVRASAATIPLRIALLVADQGTGAFQLGLARFMQ